MSNPVFAEFKRVFRDANVIRKFILVNAVVFITVNLLHLAFYLMKIQGASADLALWLAVPSNLSSLLLKPWTLITYMFLHLGFFHLFFNMIILFFGGRIFLEYLGAKNFISTYFLGGISGAIFYITAFNVFPVFEDIRVHSVALGASASVLAILVAAATYVPNYIVHFIIIGAVRLKYIAILFIFLDLLSIEKGNPGGHIAHLGGALYGFLFVSQYKKGRNIASWFDKIANVLAIVFKPRNKMKVAYSARQRKSDEDYNVLRNKNQKKLDDILDKISKSGYESLTREEKDFLFNASKNL